MAFDYCCSKPKNNQECIVTTEHILVYFYLNVTTVHSIYMRFYVEIVCEYTNTHVPGPVYTMSITHTLDSNTLFISKLKSGKLS